MTRTLLTLSLTALIAAPAQADTPINETRALAADAKVELGNVRGLIRVTGGDGRELKLTGSIGEGAKGLIIDGDEKHLKIRVDYPSSSGWGGWFGGGETGDSTLIAELPRGVELQVEAVSANIEVSEINGPRVRIENVSGDTRFAGAPQELRFETVSGDIDAELGDTREVKAESVSGDVNLSGGISDRLIAESVSGRLRLSSTQPLRRVELSVVSGDVALEAGLAPGGRITAESLSGDLELRLPSNTSAAVEANSFSGDIESAAGKVEKADAGPGSELRARIGNGDGEIMLESFSGDIRLELR